MEIKNYFVGKEDFAFKKLLFCIVINLVLLFSQKANAQHINFGSLSIENGLSQNTVNSIVQDKLGIMWFATQEGLNRFDGTSIKVYYQNTKFPELGPISNWVSTLHIDEFGYIWIGSNGQGVSRFNPILERFEHIPNTVLKSGRVQDIITKDSCIYVAFQDGGLLTWNYSKTQVLKPGSIKTIFTKYVDNSLFFPRKLEWISDTKLAIAAPSHGLFIYSTETNKTIRRIEKSENLKPTSLYYSKDSDELFVATNENGVWKYDLKTSKFAKIDEIKIDDYIHFIIEYNKSLFIGTEKQGLFVADLKNLSTIYNYESSSQQINGITDNTLYTAFKDKQDVLWIGTYLSGALTINSNHNIFITIEHQPNNTSSLRNNFVRGLAEDEKGNMWIGTRNGGVSILNMKQYKFQNELEKKINAILPAQTINTIFFDKNDQVYISTLGFGLYKINLKTFAYQHFSQDKTDYTKLLDDYVRSVYVDDENQLWVSSGLQSRGGLNIINQTEKTSFSIQHKESTQNSLPDNQINVIYPYSKDELFLGSFVGLTVLKKRSKIVNSINDLELTNYKFVESDTTSLVGNIISSIYKDQDNQIWISSYGSGISKLEVHPNAPFTFKRISNKDGLPVLGIFGILGDNENQLWLSTNKGLIKADVEKMQFFQYLKEDGISSNQFNQWSYLKLSNNFLAFGGISGITLLNPAKIKPAPFIPTVILNQLNINGQEFKSDSSISYKKSVSLNYDQNVLGFDYISISTFGGKRIQYSYKLEGLNKDWIDAGTRTFASYTNVPHGDYVFKVKARNANGLESPNIAELTIHISPPFYLTKSFILLVIASLLLLIFSLVRYREEQFSMAKKELEVKIAERTSVLQERTIELEIKTKEAEKANAAKTDFLAGMSHELRTPLNAILGFSQLLHRSDQLPERYRSYAETMYRSGTHLLTMINDVLDLSKIEAGRMEINPNSCNVDALIQDIRFMFELQSSKMNLDFSISKTTDLPEYVYLDNSKIKQVLINLIGNALKFTPQGGIQVTFSKIKLNELPDFDYQVGNKSENIFDIDYLFIQVTDTGKGIKPKHLKDIFEPFRQHEIFTQGGTGLGLSISSKLIQLHSGYMMAKSEIMKGSTFAFCIPLQESSQDELNNIEQNDEIHVLKSETPVRVLIVDDVQSNIEVLNSVLSLAGFTTTTCDSGEKALELFNKESFDLILLDLRMPRMRGEEVMLTMRADSKGKDLPIIAITASIFDESKAKLVKMGFDAVIIKPFHNKELFSILEKIAKLEFTRTHFTRTIENSATSINLLDEFEQVFKVLASHDKHTLLEALTMTDLDAIQFWVESNSSDSELWNQLLKQAISKNYKFILALSERLSELEE